MEPIRWKPAFRAAFPYTMPVLTGFVCLGMAYGVLMDAKGYGPLWATLMSAVAFCGSMQYAAITLLTMAFDPLGAFLLSLLVNARHLFYGLSLLKKYRGFGALRHYLIFALCDETYSIVCGTEPPPDVRPRDFYFAVTLLGHAYWVGATLAGSLLGRLIPLETGGLDFVLTALFVVLLLEQWKRRESRMPAALGLACAAASLLAFGPAHFIPPAMGLILAALMVRRRVLCG